MLLNNNLYCNFITATTRTLSLAVISEYYCDYSFLLRSDLLSELSEILKIVIPIHINLSIEKQQLLYQENTTKSIRDLKEEISDTSGSLLSGVISTAVTLWTSIKTVYKSMKNNPMEIDYPTLTSFSKYSKNAKLDPFLSIPDILYDSIDFLHHHMKTPDLFKKSHNVSELDNIIDYYIVNHKFDDKKVNPYQISGIILHFLKNVTSPLITQDSFEALMFIYFMRNTSSYHSSLLKQIQNIKLPNRTILEYILSFCHDLLLPENKEFNNCVESQLSTMFTNVLFRLNLPENYDLKNIGSFKMIKTIFEDLIVNDVTKTLKEERISRQVYILLYTVIYLLSIYCLFIYFLYSFIYSF